MKTTIIETVGTFEGTEYFQFSEATDLEALAKEFKSDWFEEVNNSHRGYSCMNATYARVDKNNNFVRKVVKLLEEGNIELIVQLKVSLQSKSFKDWRAEEDRGLFIDRLESLLARIV